MVYLPAIIDLETAFVLFNFGTSFEKCKPKLQTEVRPDCAPS